MSETNPRPRRKTRGGTAGLDPNVLNELATKVQEHGEALNELKDVPNTLQRILERLEPSEQPESELEGGDEFDDLFNSLSQENGDDEQLNEIMSSMEETVDYGAVINDKLAEGFARAASTHMSKETFDSIKMKEHGKVPSNCKALQVPRVNPEIWSNLPVKGRVTDVKSQNMQQNLSVGLCSLATVANELVKSTSIPKDTRADLLKVVMDAGKAIGTGFFELSMKRRNDMKPFINPEYADICSNRHPVSEFLFGSNLADKLKESKSSSELARKASVKGNRFRPYARPLSGQERPNNLNFSRPSSLPFRRGGGRRPRFQRTFYQQPQQSRQ